MSKLKTAEQILLFLTVSLLPTQLGKHFWPGFSFIYSLPVDYLSPTIYLWDILVIALCAIFLLQKKHINRTAINLFYFFLLTQGLSLIFSGNIGAGFVRMQQYLIAGLFGVYMASTKYKDIKPILFRALGLAVASQSLLAILQFIKGGTLGLWILGERTFSITTPGIAKFDFFGFQFLRPYGTFPHPNVLAGFMVTVPVILNQLSYGSRSVGRSIKSGMTILAGLTTILTVSRVALLAGFVEALILLSKKWRIAFLALIIVISPILYTRFSAVLSYDNLTFIIREDLAVNALDMFASSPIFGVGLNNFIPASSEGVVSGSSRFLQPVHNIFLLALAETGIVGLVGFLVLIGYPIKNLKLTRPSLGGKISNLKLLWVTIIFLGMFDHYFLTLPQGYRLLFLIWGLSMLKLKNAKPD